MNKTPIEKIFVHYNNDPSVGMFPYGYELDMHIPEGTEESEIKAIKDKVAELYELIEGEKPSYVMTDVDIKAEHEAEAKAYADELQASEDLANQMADMPEHCGLVTCHTCQNRFDSGAVEFLNIESDIHEQDVMTFKCPVCKTEEKSHILV